jgi:hypothetical protein
MPCSPHHIRSPTSRPPRRSRHVSTSHQVPSQPPRHITPPTSRHVPHVTPFPNAKSRLPRPITSHVTSRHLRNITFSRPVPRMSRHAPFVPTPRPSPTHVPTARPIPNSRPCPPSQITPPTSRHVPASRRVNHIPSRSHVTSLPMSRHVPYITSLPHGTSLHHVTSYPLVTSRPHVTSCPSPDPTSRQVPLLTSGPPRHVMFTTSCPPRNVTSLTFHHVLTSRTSHVTLRPLRDGLHHVPPLRHAPPHFPSQHVLTSRTSPRHATSPLNIRPHVTSRHVPHVMSPRHITSLTSYHVLTSRPSPCHATLRPPSHVSLMSRHFSHATSRPFRHGLPTSRQVPQATLRPPRNVTPHPIPQPEVTSLASHLPRHVTSFASSRHVPPHITSRPTPTSFHVPTSRSHVTKSSRHVPPHVTYRALRHVLLHVTSCPPSRQVPQDYTPLLGIPLTRTPPIPPVFPVRA